MDKPSGSKPNFTEQAPEAVVAAQIAKAAKAAKAEEAARQEGKAGAGGAAGALCVTGADRATGAIRGPGSSCASCVTCAAFNYILYSRQVEHSLALPDSFNLPHTSSTEPPTPINFIIQELRKMSVPSPPNRTIEKSDIIPFPPDWSGPIPRCQVPATKRPPNIFTRTFSFFKGKNSSTSSGSSQSSSKSKISAGTSAERHHKKSFLFKGKGKRTATLTLSGQRSTTPSTSTQSSSQAVVPTKNVSSLSDSKILEIDDEMEE